MNPLSDRFSAAIRNSEDYEFLTAPERAAVNAVIRGRAKVVENLDETTIDPEEGSFGKWVLKCRTTHHHVEITTIYARSNRIRTSVDVRRRKRRA